MQDYFKVSSSIHTDPSECDQKGACSIEKHWPTNRTLLCSYLNYGAIGEVVGHEISHGFDGFGKQFDREGQLKNWWNHATSKMFESKASCIVEQYNRYYCPEVDMHLNGVNTQVGTKLI